MPHVIIWGMSLKPMPSKRPSKKARERSVLFGLIDLFLKTGEPIGSNTLRENGFEHLSSATIRNYFAKLEKEGLLKQQHSSGGRQPTDAALRAYVNNQLPQITSNTKTEDELRQQLSEEDKEVVSSLHKVAELLSEKTNCAVFISSPRFDQDFIQNVKIVGLDASKILVILITDFGLIKTETVYPSTYLAPNVLEKIEHYFLWRLSRTDKPSFKDEAEAKLAQKIYNEIMVRHVVNYINFSQQDIFKTGLSKLLNYPEFSEPEVLTSSLSLFENTGLLQPYLNQAMQVQSTVCQIGEEFKDHIPQAQQCSLIVIPYYIHQSPVGAIAILGPKRLPYTSIFTQLESYSNVLSKHLTKNIYKFKITYRQPNFTETSAILNKKNSFLLEDKSN